MALNGRKHALYRGCTAKLESLVEGERQCYYCQPIHFQFHLQYAENENVHWLKDGWENNGGA